MTIACKKDAPVIYEYLVKLPVKIGKEVKLSEIIKGNKKKSKKNNFLLKYPLNNIILDEKMPILSK